MTVPLEGQIMFTHQAVWNGIESLAARRGWSLSHLGVAAGLDPTALNRSKRVGHDGKPRWPSMATIAKLLQATNTSLSDFCQFVETGRDKTKPGAHPHVLLVDDDGLFREMGADRLRRAGYGVDVAPSHREALDILEGGQQVDLLCTDIVMPDGLGGAALARLARKRRPTLMVLYVTGYDVPLVDGPAASIMRKPLQPDDLVCRIDQMLGVER